MSAVDADVVAALLRDAATDELLPRFRALAPTDVFAKATHDDPDDVVTAADLAVEHRLAAELAGLVPDSIVVAEEAAARDPSLLAALTGSRPVWLVDPLDGTRNFAAGRETFGVMVALCEGGCARMAWIHLPIAGQTFVAGDGSGAWLDGRRLAADSRMHEGTTLEGSVYTSFMPPELKSDVEARAARGARLVPGRRCAAVEYAALARGETDFVLYYRLLPWDHAPGALLLAETGGAARHRDGSPYRASGREPLCLATRSSAIWDAAKRAALGG